MRIPASKPHTQRALLLAALAEGESTVRRPNLSTEADLLRDACRALGAEFVDDGDAVVVRGVAGRPRRPASVLHMAGSGFALRHLLPIAALAEAPCVLTGDRRLAARPVQPLLDALGALGCRAEPVDAALVLPVIIGNTGLSGGRVEVPAHETSQFVSALMLSAPYALGPVHLSVPEPIVGHHYIWMTRDMMAKFGARVTASADLHEIDVWPGGYHAQDLVVGPDATSLFYFIAAAVIADVDIAVQDVVLGGDAIQDAAVELGRGLGVRIEQDGGVVHIVSGPPPERLVEVDASDIPTLVPALAALASSLPNGMLLRGARHVGFHKTNRLQVVMDGLAALGRILAPVHLGGALDGFRTEGTVPPSADRLDSHGDHRNFMALYLASLAVERPVEILGAETLSTSFADFETCFRALSTMATPA